jgi:predicted transcriptional regulator
MKYRDRTEIITAMLRSASRVNGACKTRIMHEAFLSVSQLKEYFPLLLRNGLVEYDVVMKTFKITVKGYRVLELSVNLRNKFQNSQYSEHEKMYETNKIT